MDMHRSVVTILALVCAVSLGACAGEPIELPVAVVTVIVTVPSPAEATPAPSPTAQALASETPAPPPAQITIPPPEAMMTEMADAMHTMMEEGMGKMVEMAVETVIMRVSSTPTFTPSPTVMPLLIAVERLTPTPIPAATTAFTPTPAALPAQARDKILFLTDRFKKREKDPPTILAMDPDGRNVALLTNDWVYNRALELDRLSPDGSQEVFIRNRELWVVNKADGWTWYLFGRGGTHYEPAWSPDAGYIAFVSRLGSDEIQVINKDIGEVKQLTSNPWEWDKHPSFSPDGSRIVFWSNRETGRQQIWVMNADGSHPVNISNNPYNDWDPVWVK